MSGTFLLKGFKKITEAAEMANRMNFRIIQFIKMPYMSSWHVPVYANKVSLDVSPDFCLSGSGIYTYIPGGTEFDTCMRCKKLVNLHEINCIKGSN